MMIRKKEETMNNIIEVENLSKAYGRIKAVDKISFYVEKGKLFAFLGPNGAGKSTTINSLCTFLQPDEGKVMVNNYQLGKQDDEIRKSIGIVFQDSILDDLLTVEENLELRGSFYEMKGKELKDAIRTAANATEIQGVMKRPYGKLSGGQRRRVDIARALIHTPEILFLDEPTTGLDPQTRKNVWDTIKKLQKEKGMTVFLTTHYMEEAEEADYCIIIDDGKIAAKGTPFELKEKHAKDKLKIKGIDYQVLKNTLTEDARIYTEKAEFFSLPLENTMDALPILNSYQNLLSSFTVVQGSMDDVFIGVTGKEIRE